MFLIFTETSFMENEWVDGAVMWRHSWLSTHLLFYLRYVWFLSYLCSSFSVLIYLLLLFMIQWIFFIFFYSSAVTILCQVTPHWQEGHGGLRGNWDVPSGLVFLHHWAKQLNQFLSIWQPQFWEPCSVTSMWPDRPMMLKVMNHAALPWQQHKTVQGGTDKSGLIFTQQQNCSLQVETLTSPNVDKDQMHAGKCSLRISLKEEDVRHIVHLGADDTATKIHL